MSDRERDSIQEMEDIQKGLEAFLQQEMQEMQTSGSGSGKSGTGRRTAERPAPQMFDMTENDEDEEELDVIGSGRRARADDYAEDWDDPAYRKRQAARRETTRKTSANRNSGGRSNSNADRRRQAASDKPRRSRREDYADEYEDYEDHREKNRSGRKAGKREEIAAKEKKPKKEKKRKEKKEKIPEVPEKKLSLKKVIPIVVVCISLGAVILLLSSFLTEYMTRRSGRKAYYAGDYQTCYQNFFGKELDETEQVMYSKSESILTIRMWLREYEVFVNEGSELEALDSLLQAVHDYPSLLNYATEYNAQDEVTVAFQEILNVLSQKYGLSQEEAQEIADISNNVEYTQRVMTVLQKLGLESWDMPQIVEDATPSNDGEEAAELPDPLPEEKEIQQ